MSIQISATLEPKTSGEFPVVEDINVKGGFRALGTLDERNTIPMSFRKKDMLVAVLGTLYILDADLITWRVLSTRGERGATGDRGSQGVAGANASSSGPRGPKGDKGDTGGAKGDKGDRGIQGIKGDRGDAGATGARGLAGAKGDKGDKGDAGGPRGLQGLQGIQGVAGPRGYTGAKGDKGDRGLQGIQGVSGLNGTNGIDAGGGLILSLVSSTHTHAVLLSAEDVKDLINNTKESVIISSSLVASHSHSVTIIFDHTTNKFRVVGISDNTIDDHEVSFIWDTPKVLLDPNTRVSVSFKLAGAITANSLGTSSFTPLDPVSYLSAIQVLVAVPLSAVGESVEITVRNNGIPIGSVELDTIKAPQFVKTINLSEKVLDTDFITLDVEVSGVSNATAADALVTLTFMKEKALSQVISGVIATTASFNFVGNLTAWRSPLRSPLVWTPPTSVKATAAAVFIPVADTIDTIFNVIVKRSGIVIHSWSATIPAGQTKSPIVDLANVPIIAGDQLTAVTLALNTSTVTDAILLVKTVCTQDDKEVLAQLPREIIILNMGGSLVPKTNAVSWMAVAEVAPMRAYVELDVPCITETKFALKLGGVTTNFIIPAGSFKSDIIDFGLPSKVLNNVYYPCSTIGELITVDIVNPTGASNALLCLELVTKDNISLWLAGAANGSGGGGVGAKGDKGDAGAAGVAGATGATGATGPQGIKGDQGLQGLQGLKGDKGDTGSQGVQGFTGPAGIGSQGIQGIKGDQGLQGLQGLKGDKGDTGESYYKAPMTVISIAGVATCNFNAANVFRITLHEDTTFVFSNGLDMNRVMLEITQDSSFSHTVTFPASVTYNTDIVSYDAPEVGKRDKIMFQINTVLSKHDVLAVSKGFN